MTKLALILLCLVLEINGLNTIKCFMLILPNSWIYNIELLGLCCSINIKCKCISSLLLRNYLLVPQKILSSRQQSAGHLLVFLQLFLVWIVFYPTPLASCLNVYCPCGCNLCVFPSSTRPSHFFAPNEAWTSLWPLSGVCTEHISAC